MADLDPELNSRLEKLNPTLGKVFAISRQYLGYDRRQEEFAGQIGITRSVLSRIENGRSVPQAETIEGLLNAVTAHGVYLSAVLVQRALDQTLLLKAVAADDVAGDDFWQHVTAFYLSLPRRWRQWSRPLLMGWMSLLRNLMAQEHTTAHEARFGPPDWLAPDDTDPAP